MIDVEKISPKDVIYEVTTMKVKRGRGVLLTVNPKEVKSISKIGERVKLVTVDVKTNKRDQIKKKRFKNTFTSEIEAWCHARIRMRVYAKNRADQLAKELRMAINYDKQIAEMLEKVAA